MNKDYLNSSEIEKQESLDAGILKKLQVSGENSELFQSLLEGRPTANFLDLMKWTQDKFLIYLKDQKDLNRFVHNRIIIDGQFLQFCKQNKVSVTQLYSDSVISWKTDSGFEKFFFQGVFHIKGKNFEFLHAALFHKGNQNEDEVGFFVIVSNNNYEAYIKFRNEFDDWVQERDRGNLHIRVINGEDVPYTKDYTWDDVFLPKDIKNEIKKLVENFLASKDLYLSNKIPWKRGILLFGQPGCGKSTLIKTLISVYNFKPVTINPERPEEAIAEAFFYAEEQSPALLFFEDLDSLLERVDVSMFLNLMDGISAKNGMLVVATANEVKKLKSNITDRPSRFDRKYKIPLPDQEMTFQYLKKWFNNLITDAKCKELSIIAYKNKFSYAYLKDIYISVMNEAVANNRKKPSNADIKVALDRLVKEKNILGSNTISTDKYFK